MTPNDTISIALLLSVASLVCTLISTYGGQSKRKKEEVEAEITRRADLKEEFVKVNFKLDEFCRRLDEAMKRFDKTDQRLEDHERRISDLEKELNHERN
jgi:chromosome segregation ATPase